MALGRNDIVRFMEFLDEDIPNDEEELNALIALLDRAIRSEVILPEAPPAPKAKRKKIWHIVSAVLFYGLLATLIVCSFFISRGDKKPVLGYSFMNVITWSMEPEIPQGSLIIVKQVDSNTIRIGDDITYMKDSETSVTHRVIGITEDFENSGARGFETQGINNDTPDFEIVRAENVAGVVKISVPRIGSWLDWLRANLVLVVCFGGGILLLALLLRGAFKKAPAQKRKTNPHNNTVRSVAA